MPADADAPAADDPPCDDWLPPGYDPDDDDRLAQAPAPAWPPLPVTITQLPPVLGRPPPGRPATASPPPAPPGPASPAGPAAGATEPGSRPPPGTGTGTGTRRPPPGLLDLTIAWSTLTGAAATPAHLGRIGPITPGQALPLTGIAALDPHTAWRVILTDPAGHALAVDRVRRGPPRENQEHRPPGVIGRVTVTIPASALTQPPPDSTPGDHGIRAAVLRTARRAATRAEKTRAADTATPGGCAHTAASPSYRPPTRIREYVEARDQTCRQPRCRQPAWRADLDHTIPWHRGGLTCGCNLGGHCRTHHQIKAQPGWSLRQPRPGYFELTTPAGRTYQSGPDTYPA
jgi:hypothetical protein